MSITLLTSSLDVLSQLAARLLWGKISTLRTNGNGNSPEKNKKPPSSGLLQDASRLKNETLIDSPQLEPELTQQTVDAVTGILGSYRLACDNSVNWDQTIVATQVQAFVTSNKPIGLILPAFPFKSPNRTEKVLGPLPDAGEEVALMHLNGIASAIQLAYAPGAIIYIISDGLVYNDILGVDDEEVWDYGQALRQVAVDCRLSHLRFLRQHDIFDCCIDSDSVSKEQYLTNIAKIRHKLAHGLPSDAEVDDMIRTDLDTTLVYRGYLKFLELDLAKSATESSKAQEKKRLRAMARQMIARGYAFRKGIAAKYPDHVRLSIHPSTNVSKLSIHLTNQKGGHVKTPWHSTLVRAVDGKTSMSHRGTVNHETHELVIEHGRPAYFRERSPLFDWPGMDVHFRYMYPTGIIISAREEHHKYSIKDVPMQRLRALAMQCSPVILRGFKDVTDEEVFISSARCLGELAPWKSRIKATVKNAHGTNSDTGNAIVTSSEAMPMHQDGFFFLKPKLQPDGTTKMESAKPRFQYFAAIKCSAPGTGYTLFASSRLFFERLGPSCTIEDLRELTWDCRHSSDWEEHMKNLEFVFPHPETGEDCFNFLEPWPQCKTQFAYNTISIENGPQRYLDEITKTLYDYRVTLRFEWCPGDVLLSDNMKMLHTRTAFSDTEERELWRIHIN